MRTANMNEGDFVSATIPCTVIGHVHSPYVDTRQTPVQASLNAQSGAEVVLLPDYADALLALDEFDYMWIISLLGEPLRELTSMTEIPHLLLNAPRQIGAMATRGPGRPNPFGLSLVKIDAIVDNIIQFRGVDLIDGTPVLDVKPYVTRFDCPIQPLRNGWYDTIEIADGTIPATGGRPK
jgi:tRNA-Thr(GGU) m(6)t(6)A37 methyltransferase TsaA